jgi:hypothetical protein
VKVADSFHKLHCAGYYPLLVISDIPQTIKMDTIIIETIVFSYCRDSVVGIATGYRLTDRRVGVQISVGSEFSLLHVVQSGSCAHPASYAMGSGGSFPGDEAAGA